MGQQTSDGKKAKKGTSQVALIGLAIFGVAVIAIGGIGLGFLAWRFPLPQTPLVALMVTGGAFALFTLMLSQAINMSVQALFERRDLDLLLSSPLKPRVVLTVRAVSIALVAVMLYAALATPFIVTASVLGRPEWLGLYVLLIALAMVATTLGIMLTLGLFAAIGPRATRTVAQILAGVTGGIAFLASQMWNLTRPADEDDGAGPLYASLQGVLGHRPVRSRSAPGLAGPGPDRRRRGPAGSRRDRPGRVSRPSASAWRPGSRPMPPRPSAARPPPRPAPEPTSRSPRA